MSEDEHIIIAGVLQSPSRTADIIQLDKSYFTSIETSYLFTLISKYRLKTGMKNYLDMPLLRSKLERGNGKTSARLLGVIEGYESWEPIADSEFRDAFRKVSEQRSKRILTEKGAEAIEGAIEGDVEKAKKDLQSVLAKIDDSAEIDRPRDVKSQIEVELEKNEIENPTIATGTGFDIGFSRIKECLSLRRCELAILGGYTADGKSILSKCFAYNANRSGANVLYVALEMEYREMLVLFIAQHAAMLNPSGLDYKKILDGTLNSSEKKLYLRALDDFSITRQEDDIEIKTESGHLHIWSPRKEIRMGHLVERITSMNHDVGLDIAFVDYLELVEPDRDFGQYRLNVKKMAERCKWISREEQILMFVNHQISRGGRDAAEKRDPKHYVMRDMGESSGVEKSADHVLWIYNDEDLYEEREVKIGIAKTRKGAKIAYGFHAHADFAKAIVVEMEDE